jgi:hypothetical protein
MADKKKAAEPQIPKEKIWVRSTLEPKTDGGHTCVLWEVNKAHPGGECYIAGPKPVLVAQTPDVRKALISGTIEEVADPNAVKAAEKPPANNNTPKP